MQDKHLRLRVVIRSNHHGGQRVRKFALDGGDRRSAVSYASVVSRSCLAGRSYREREAHHCHNPFHVRTPICFTNSCTSNGGPCWTTPTSIFFMGNVAATWNTASSSLPSCVHGVSGDSGSICSMPNIDARYQTAMTFASG